jgi:hypothetical protein
VRWWLLLLLVAIPRLALAEPKVAVAPLDSDAGNKLAETVGEAVSEHAKLTKPARVEGAMRSMGVSALTGKSIKKLRKKLDVDVVIYGSVEKDGKTQRISLTFAGSSKNKPTLELEVKTPAQLRKDLSGKLAKRIDAAMDGAGGDDEEEDDEEDTREAERKAREEERKKKEEEEERKREEEKRRKKEEEDERKREEEAKRKNRDEDERRAKRDEDEEDNRRKRRGDDEDDRRKRRGDDEEDGDRKKKRVAEEDEDEEDGGRARKRLGDEDEEDEDEDGGRRKKRRAKRHVLTHAALWADGGASFARRTLRYDSTAMNRPPPVGTLAPAGRIEGEVYPAAFSSLKGAAAGFGLYGVFNYTFALSITIPGTNTNVPVKSGHYLVGARYRFVIGQHSLAAGVSYWRRHYMADRSGLMMQDQLDMPDVDYSAIAPGAAAHIAVTPKIAAFATVDVPLMLYSGPIQLPANYGAAKILAFDVRGGAQIMVAGNAALQIAAEFDQIALTFTGQPGSKSATRMVSKATDRSIGLAATVGVTF